MGHNRLQYPPDTQKWLPVVEAVADGAEVLCNDGEELTDEEKLDIACEFIGACAPPAEPTDEQCKQFLAQMIDCLEEELCRSLTEEEIEALAECTTNCEPEGCCTPGAGWSCGESFLCDRANCDGVIDCADIEAFIAESEAGCNGGVPYDREDPDDREKLVELICEFFANCGSQAGPDICAGLRDCLAGILGGTLSAKEEEALAICTGCGEICDPNDGAGNGKPGEGDDGCDGQGARAAGPGGTDAAYGDVTRSETDAVVDAAGPTLVLSRQYTSDAEFESGCQNPENWTNTAFGHVDGSVAGTLRIGGNALGTISVDISGGGSGPWPLPGPTSRVLSHATATVGAGSVDVWRIADPGRAITDYYRTAGSMDPELAALDGLLLRTQDPYGNLHFYDYAFYGIENPVPRLRRIFVNGSPEAMALEEWPDALVEFAWVLEGENAGRLERTDVHRFNGPHRVLVQRVAYTYFDAATHHPDVGTSGDLVQVVVSERIDPVVGPGGSMPFGGESWRRRVTQYRYHGGDGATEEVEDRYEWAGGVHQLKLVIEPEQFEYLAQRLVAQGDGPGGLSVYDVDELAPLVLTLADGEVIWMNDADGDDEVDGSEQAPLVDFATTVYEVYETAGERRVLAVYSMAEGGCGGCGSSSGGTHGSRLLYTYIDRDSDPTVAETVKIEERLRKLPGAGSGFETSPYRIVWLEYDRPAGAGGVPYLRSSAVQDPSETDWYWVTLYQHDPSTRTLLAEYTPAAVSAYTPGTAMTAPSYTIATSGLVRVFGWTADNRLARRELSDGQPTFTGTTCTDCVLVEEWIYGDGTGDTRAQLVEEQRRYRRDPAEMGFDSSTDVETTTFTYAFHGGSGDDLAWVKAEVEAEREAENGPGSPAWYASYEFYDERGDNVWSVAADGAITAREFESGNAGQLRKVVRNAANTMPSTIEGLSTTGFGRNGDGGSLETRFVRDLLGRIRETVQPGNVSTYTLRNAFVHPDRPGLRYFCEVSLPPVVDAAAGRYAGPATVTWYTAGGKAFATSSYRPGIGGYQFAPSPMAQIDYPILVSGYVLSEELSRRIIRHDVSGQVKVVMEWNALTGPPGDPPPPLLDGPNNGVHVTLFGQDRLGRPHWTINANGTAERMNYDVLDRVVATEIGVADTSDWIPDDATMTVVTRHYYDSGGTTTPGIGNGNLTRLEQVVSGSGMSEVVRATVLKYDWRDRRYSTVNPLPPHDWTEYDNLDRPVAQATFTAVPTAIDAPLNSGADFRGRYTETSYSQRGLVYRQAVATNPKSSTPSFLESHTWFDQVGRSVGAWGPNGPMQKMAYDGLGRPTVVYLTDRRNDPLPGASGNFAAVFNLSTHAANVSDDVVLEQASTRYVAGRGVLDLSTRRVRTHDATTSDVGALDSGGYPSNKVITTYSGAWYDVANRAIRQAQYGTNAVGFQSGGSAPTIVQSSPPSSNAADATKLVTETRYDARGLVESLVDPMGRITRFHHDALGRRIMVIENFDPSNPVQFAWVFQTAAPGTAVDRMEWQVTAGLDYDHPDRNRVTSFVFDGLGNVVRQSAYLVERVLDDPGPPPMYTDSVRVQETAYLYGVAVSSGSSITSNDLLGRIYYPDSDRTLNPLGTTRRPTSLAYNRQGEVVSMQDANHTTHAYTRDALGRVTLDKVTVSGSMPGFQVDDTINAIESEFDALGRMKASRSFTDHGGGGQAVVNAVQLGYDDLWQVVCVAQQHDGDVSGGSPAVEIDYDVQPVASGNRSRRTLLTYPDGWELATTYGTSGSIGDRISRVLSLRDPGANATYVTYSHLGISTPVIVNYAVPGVSLNRFLAHNGTTTTGVYPGLDRYGRVARQLWVDRLFGPHATLGTVPNMPPIVETAYMYDNASSRTGAFDARPGSAQPLSHRYDHDGLHRLTEAIRGVWNGSLTTPAVTQLRNSQAWGLDPLGNWLEVATDLDGAGSFDADEVETRDFRDPVTSTNRVNELHQRILAVDAGGDELALTYDFAGNLIRQELTNDGTDATALQFTYDAWNRLVQVEFEDEEEDLHPRGEYEYNGLNQRTVARADSNVTNSTHALDEKRMMYYSPEWRLLEERVDANYQSSPGINSHVQYVWGERYIDDIVATRHDPDPAEEDGYEVVHFHLTDVQFSTVAMLSSTAVVLERVTYSAYGMARHHPFSDVDGDGDADTTDVGLVNAAIGKVIGDVGYRSEFDLNRDGSITLADRGLMSAASALPEGVLSSAAVGNRIGYCGYVFAPETQMYLARIRWLSTVLGRWGQRDPIEYIDGQNLYSYVKISPISYTDPFGLQASWSYLNIWQRHHPIPLRLGGCPKQPLFHLPRDQHQLITNWWDKHFPKEGAGLAKWNRCSPARQRWIIRATMMRFAKVPEDVLGSCMDDIFKGLRTVPQPRGYGKVVWRYGTGRILGVAFGAAGVIDMFASDCYAPTLALPPQDWRELVGDSRKCMCECTTELIQKIEPCWWAIFEQEEYSTIPCANEPWIGLDDMTALECRDLEGIIEAREVGSATGFTIYEMEVVTCRWAGIRYGLPGAPLPSW